MKRAIITGCTGAVGVALINELIENEWHVIAVPRKDSVRMHAIPTHENIKIIECNLDEIENLPQKIRYTCDVFYHLAWDGTYGTERTDCIRQNRNVDYTLRAVHCAKELGCSVFVGVGSQSECGHVTGKLSTDIVCTPNNPYGAAKLSACHMSRILCEQLGIRQNWCRLLSLYGPHDGEHTMIMSIVRTLLRGERPACTKGTQVWDYIYSKDAAKALCLIAEKGKKGVIYYLGSGQTKLLREYIEIIRDAINPTLEIGFGEIPFYPNQVMHLEADISDLKRDTGFEVSYTFEEGIKETIAWCKENDNG